MTTIAERVSVGVGLPQVFSSDRVDLALIGRYAPSAERLGFSTVWVQEGLFTAAPFLDPIELLAFTAALTHTVRLGIAVIVVPRHNPVVLAKRLATLDQLSGGRLIVGVGVGRPGEWPGQGNQAGGSSRDRFLEGVELLTALWSRSGVRHDGDLWRVVGEPMEPKPWQRPRLPLWFGGGHPAALARAARLADGWIGAGAVTMASFARQARIVEEELERHGRERTTFTVSKRVYIGVDDEHRASRRWHEYRAGVYGTGGPPDEAVVLGGPDRCREMLDAIIAAGADHLVLTPVFDDEAQLEAVAEITGLRTCRQA